MAKGSTTNFPEQNVERAMLAANYEMDWMREIAEQRLNRSRTIFEEFLATGRITVDIVDGPAACDGANAAAAQAGGTRPVAGADRASSGSAIVRSPDRLDLSARGRAGGPLGQVQQGS